MIQPHAGHYALVIQEATQGMKMREALRMTLTDIESVLLLRNQVIQITNVRRKPPLYF